MTSYVYDREDILLEHDGAGSLIARYTHGAGIDEPLIMARDLDGSGAFESTEHFFYHTDALGSVTELTDLTGTVSQAYVYDAYGNLSVFDAAGSPLAASAAIPNPFTYTGREFDPESGLYYYRARYYDPHVGRFISEDPIGFGGGDVNLYAYVSGNPINFVDPFGLLTPKDIALGVAGYIIVKKVIPRIIERIKARAKRKGVDVVVTEVTDYLRNHGFGDALDKLADIYEKIEPFVAVVDAITAPLDNVIDAGLDAAEMAIFPQEPIGVCTVENPTG